MVRLRVCKSIASGSLHSPKDCDFRDEMAPLSIKVLVEEVETILRHLLDDQRFSADLRKQKYLSIYLDFVVHSLFRLEDRDLRTLAAFKAIEAHRWIKTFHAPRQHASLTLEFVARSGFWLLLFAIDKHEDCRAKEAAYSVLSYVSSTRIRKHLDLAFKNMQDQSTRSRGVPLGGPRGYFLWTPLVRSFEKKLPPAESPPAATVCNNLAVSLFVVSFFTCPTHIL